MHPTCQPDPVFPLSGGSSPRPQLRPPRLPGDVALPAGRETGPAAGQRPWAEHRRREALLTGGPAAVATPG